MTDKEGGGDYFTRRGAEERMEKLKNGEEVKEMRWERRKRISKDFVSTGGGTR